MGVALYPDDGERPALLLSRAISAMGEKDEETRNRWVYACRELNVLSDTRRMRIDVFRQALEAGELELFYQPIVSAATRLPVAMEALLRWRNAKGQLVPASRFVAFAEQSGLALRMDEYVINRVGRQIKHWHSSGVDCPPVAINICAEHFRSASLVGSIEGMLAQYGIDPTLIELELTESALIDDIDAVIANCERLRVHGVRIAIDDFGTEFASLDYLRRFPVDRLKIDRSFVSDLDSERTAVIVRSVIDLAHALDMRVTAEGVETGPQAGRLQALGCDELQGYLFGAAVESQKAEWLQQAANGVCTS